MALRFLFHVFLVIYVMLSIFIKISWISAVLSKLVWVGKATPVIDLVQLQVVCNLMLKAML